MGSRKFARPLAKDVLGSENVLVIVIVVVVVFAVVVIAFIVIGVVVSPFSSS